MASAEQRARAEAYRDAAGEHVLVARELYEAEHLVLANYVAGLAVECILRGYRYMVDPNFDARHNIAGLSELAKFRDVVPADRFEKVSAWLGTVVWLWSNDNRFESLSSLRKRWSKRKLYEGIRGDFVKERTRQLLNAATELVNLGVARWKNSFNN